jgi:hypothetical protein
MTLLISLLDRAGVHISSDYRISDSGKVVQTEHGTKQLEFAGRNWFAQIAFTGLARDGHAYDTRAWLRAILLGLSAESSVQDLTRQVAERGTQELLGVRGGYDRRLTVLVGYVSEGKAGVVLISNWESTDGPPLLAPRSSMTVTLIDSRRPSVRLNGYVSAVESRRRKRLQRLLRSAALPEQLRESMAALNLAASKKAPIAISEGCWIRSLLASGHSAGQNEGRATGLPTHVMDGVDVTALLSAEFGNQLGTLLTSAGYTGPGKPAPTKLGEPRQIVIASPAAELPIGGFAFLRIHDATGSVVVRRNDSVEFELTRVVLEIPQQGAPLPPPFKAKRVPMPAVPTVDGAQPRSWSYSVELDWDGRTLVASVAQMSMAFRSVNLPAPMPLLGEFEELVMVSLGLSLQVSLGEPTISTRLRMRLWLREFPERW